MGTEKVSVVQCEQCERCQSNSYLETDFSSWFKFRIKEYNNLYCRIVGRQTYRVEKMFLTILIK